MRNSITRRELLEEIGQIVVCNFLAFQDPSREDDRSGQSKRSYPVFEAGPIIAVPNDQISEIRESLAKARQNRQHLVKSLALLLC